MAPCEVEIRAPGSEKWMRIGQVGPGDQPSSFSNIRKDGVREIVVFECSKDDSETRIFLSGLQIEWKAEGSRISDSELFQLVKTLKEGESCEVNITTVRRKKAVVRFTHK
jgi:hypothetical protein